MPSKDFLTLMNECIELHNKKSHDYAGEGDAFSNFTRAADFALRFSNPLDKVFATLIGIKFARLEQLLSGKIPKNESIDDTFMDMVNYAALWGASRRAKAEANWGTVPEFLRHKPNEPMPLHNTIVDNTKREATYTNNLPDICSNCNRGDSSDMIKHAVEMHQAIFNKAQQTIKYPTRGLFILDPSFFE